MKKQFPITSLFEGKDYQTIYFDADGSEAGRITKEGKKFKAQQLTGKKLTALCPSIGTAEHFIQNGNTLFSSAEIINLPAKRAKQYQLWLKNEHGQKKLLKTFEAGQLRQANYQRAKEQRERGEAYTVELIPIL